ncbi:hypothetical protein C1H46_004472 [Malus baccata]|uniref:Uncharacterized protein n=1 Tax=Malus baccata TaxID=106549 RepID=A0A540NFS3_MALBA|nr:hypothetical protein C1H46_004472 [Malus baccata]
METGRINGNFWTSSYGSRQVDRTRGCKGLVVMVQTEMCGYGLELRKDSNGSEQQRFNNNGGSGQQRQKACEVLGATMLW